MDPILEDKYIDILIALIRRNKSRMWDSSFEKLHEDRYLPGGGAGSLNDWGPIYESEDDYAWFSSLYNLMRYLFDHKYKPERIKHHYDIKNYNKLLVIQCLICKQSRQHPGIFERQIALSFYHKYLAHILYNENWRYIFYKNKTRQADFSRDYRKKLKKTYKALGINVVSNKQSGTIATCHICGSNKFDHLHYKLETEQQFNLKLMRRT